MIVKNKKGIESEYAGWLLLALAALAIAIGIILVVTGKGTAAIQYLKNIFSFGK